MNEYLYRLYGHLGELLYIGVTDNIGSRFAAHRKTKPWWSDVASMSIEVYPSRPDVLAAESEAIRLEQPRYNQVHAEARDLQQVPRWQRRFRLEDFDGDWLKVVIANNILDWSSGYDGRTGCLQIHPDLFNALVRQVSEGIKHANRSRQRAQ